jgi:hypothetical protein
MAEPLELCSPQIASGPLADLGYQEEVCLGDIPEDRALITCRRRSTTLGLTKDAYASEEIRSDRMISDSRHGIRRVGGDIVTELSVGAHADFMEALLGGVWVTPTPANLTTAAITSTPQGDGTVIFTSATFNWLTAGFRKGDTIKFDTTGNADYDGKVFTLVNLPVTDPDPGVGPVLAVASGTFAPANLDPVAFAAGTMAVGGARVEMGNIYRSFVFERAFTDIGSFIVYTGCRINTMAVDLPPTGIATATYAVMGKNATPIQSASIDGVPEVVLTDSDLDSLAFDAATGTITATSGNFVTAGIVPGDKVIIAGDGITDHQNRNPRTVVAVATNVLTVAEAIQTSDTPYNAPFTLTRVGLPEYTVAPDGAALAAVSGVLLVEGKPAATVTAMTFTVDNQMASSDVVGSNFVPTILYGNQCNVSGSMTVLFDRGGIGEAIYNAFDLETDNVAIVMRLENAEGTDAITFTFPRCKVNSGSIGDAAAEGLPVTVDFQALKPHADHPEDGVSQIAISDTSVGSGVAPFTAMVEPEAEPEASLASKAMKARVRGAVRGEGTRASAADSEMDAAA